MAKYIIKPNRIRLHPDLDKYLRQRGYQFISVLYNPPPNAGQEDLIYLVTMELDKLQFNPQNGDVTAIIGGMGIGSQWIGILEAVKAKISGALYVIIPRFEGKGAKFSCWVGEKQTILP